MYNVKSLMTILTLSTRSQVFVIVDGVEKTPPTVVGVPFDSDRRTGETSV